MAKAATASSVMAEPTGVERARVSRALGLLAELARYERAYTAEEAGLLGDVLAKASDIPELWPLLERMRRAALVVPELELREYFTPREDLIQAPRLQVRGRAPAPAAEQAHEVVGADGQALLPVGRGGVVGGDVQGHGASPFLRAGRGQALVRQGVPQPERV